MNLNKHRDFFNPENLETDIHIIGCGAVGSTIAEQMARLGVKRLHLYDFDTVTAHNITNQMFFASQIGEQKTKAITAILKLINPEIEVIQHNKGWIPNTPLSGYVFLAVDNIETRKEIVDNNICNQNIIAMFDARMGLTNAQAFATLWNDEGRKKFKETMNFTHEEAKTETPISACGTTLSVTPTVRIICSYIVANFINVTLGQPITKTIFLDAFDMTLDAFDDNGLKE